MQWHQYQLTLPAFNRGFHVITGSILSAAPAITTVKTGIVHIFIQHTSASLSINENVSSDVRLDMESFINTLIPDQFPGFTHTMEGPDDMPAHVKASFFGNNLTIPIREGKLGLGTWQGIYLGEHRNNGGRRNLVITVNGTS